MEFLPADYKEPSTEKFTKIEKGNNTLRILTPAVYGLEYWTDEVDQEDPGKIKSVSHRVPLNTIIPDSELRVNKWGRTDYPKIFWAFAVYNIEKDAIQIFQTTTGSIRDGIRNLISNPKWGDPSTYNIVINKTGEDKDTKYTVNAEPKEELPAEILERFEAKGIKMEAMLTGENPFGNEDEGEQITSEEVDQLMNNEEVPLPEEPKE